MESKIKMTNVTGIVTMVFGGLWALLGLILFIVGIAFATSFSGGTSGGIFLIVFSLIIIAGAVTQIVLGLAVIRKSPEMRTNPNACSGLLIGIAIASFFVGGWIVLVLAIISLCMGNENTIHTTSYNPHTGYPQQGGYTYGNNPYPNVAQPMAHKIQECEVAMARLKQYKADGVITEEVYKQKVEELVNKLTE